MTTQRDQHKEALKESVSERADDLAQRQGEDTSDQQAAQARERDELDSLESQDANESSNT